jgi:murein DD-endopeptidase MepM/ murein hydrolase activator NlpD
MLLALGIWVLTRKRVEFGVGWVWPLSAINVGGRIYKPVISDGWGSPRGDEIHTGVDIMFARKNANDLTQRFVPYRGSRDGTPNFFAPPRVPVLAAKDAEVWSVKQTNRGWAVTLDHGKPWATYYAHLASTNLALHERGVNVNTGQPTRVRAGDIIGIMGFDPSGDAVRHLHFEVWHGGTADAAIDPEQAMASWPSTLVTPVQ